MIRILCILSVITFWPFIARAQESQPGDPCSVAGTTRDTGGPEQIPARRLICDGATWKTVSEQATNGRTLFQVGEDAGSCSTDKTGRLRYASSTDTWEYCTGSAWSPFEHASGSAPGLCPVAEKIYAGDYGPDFSGNVWGNGTNIFALNTDNRIRAYRFNGTSWTLRAQANTTNLGTGIWDDGTYIYVTAGNAGIHAFTYNDTTNTWSAPVTYNTAGSANGVWGDGTYIYVADGNAGVAALSFNGTAWTYHATYNTPGTAYGVWGDGTYIYVADDGGGLRALTWDGTSWTSRGTYTAIGEAYGVAGYSGYIYLAAGYDGLRILTFNGSSFSLKKTYDTVAASVWIDAHGFVYVAAGVVEALAFDGTDISVIGYFPAPYGGASSAWGDGSYLYVLDNFDGLIAYPQCQP